MTLKNTSGQASKVNSTADRLTVVLFIIYLLVLCWILLFKVGVRFTNMGTRSYNLIPFDAFLTANAKIDVVENVLNIVIFVPLGIYTGILFERWRFGRQLAFFFLTSAMVEILQFILAIGAFDTTDIITNTLGGVIGLMIWKAIQKAFNSRSKAQKFINIIAATGTVIMVLFLLLLKMKLLPIRYQ